MNRAAIFGGIVASLSDPASTLDRAAEAGSATLEGGAERRTKPWQSDHEAIVQPVVDRPAKAEHSSRRASAAGDSSATVAGVRISHPDRVIYPDLEISKIQFARYFERIADWIVPHVAGRPLTLVHCPAGIAAPCHFLKHAKAWGPSALRRVRIQEKTKVGEYLVADSIEAVVSLAQMGIVEIHTWNSTADDIERPNRIVWDLDPGPEVSWKQVVKAAELVRDVLTTLKLRSWVKTTGGRGLHVVVPLKPKRTVAECLDFSRAVSEAIVRRGSSRLYDSVREVRPRATRSSSTTSETTAPTRRCVPSRHGRGPARRCRCRSVGTSCVSRRDAGRF